MDDLNGAALQDLLERELLAGQRLVSAGWSDDMRDLEVGLGDGRVLFFRDCLQASFHRSPSAALPLEIAAYWTDEPSPLLVSFGPSVQFQYQHLVLDLEDGLLRIAFRRLEVVTEGDDSP